MSEMIDMSLLDVGNHIHGHGRKKIMIPKPEILNENNLSIAIKKAVAIHEKIAKECDFLWHYYEGLQPILNRKKIVRPDICHKVVVNHAYEIVTFKNGYIFGEPVQYVQKGKLGIDSGYSKENLVSPLNELMNLENKAQKDKSLGKWMHVTGIGYRMTLPRKEPDRILKIATLDPRWSFVVYDTDIEETPWLCGKYFITTDNDNNVYRKLCCYTENLMIVFDFYGNKDKDHMTISNTAYGFLPIIEYQLNEERQGCFEPVLDIMDEINTIESNVADLIEQNVQHLIVYKNCDVTNDQHDDFIQRGAIKVTDKSGRQGDVKVLKVDMALAEIQNVIDAKYNTILQICSMPDRKTSSGGNTGSSVEMGQGWRNTETCAKDTTSMFNPPEYQFLSAVLRIIRDSSGADPELKKLKLGEIGIQFTRNRTDNYLVKTQGLLSELQAGVHPRQALIDCGLFSDPEQVYVDSKDRFSKWESDTTETSQQETKETIADIAPKTPITV